MYDPRKAHGPLDRLLLRGASAGKSPKELSALTNGVLSPERAAQRVRDILASRDWLSQLERKQLLLDDISQLKDTLMEKAVEYKSLDHAKALMPLLKLLKDVLEADKIDVTQAMAQIREGHARIMLGAIQLAFENAALELSRRHPDVPRAELQALILESLPPAVEAVEARVERAE